MSTGLTTWHMNPLDIGPMYPFPGSEMFWVVLGLATWILWHLLQIRAEHKALREEDEGFKHKSRLAWAMRISKAETLIEVLKGALSADGDDPPSS